MTVLTHQFSVKPPEPMLQWYYSLDNRESVVCVCGQDKIVMRSKVLQDFVAAGQPSIENK